MEPLIHLLSAGQRQSSRKELVCGTAGGCSAYSRCAAHWIDWMQFVCVGVGALQCIPQLLSPLKFGRTNVASQVWWPSEQYSAYR